MTNRHLAAIAALSLLAAGQAAWAQTDGAASSSSGAPAARGFHHEGAPGGPRGFGPPGVEMGFGGMHLTPEERHKILADRFAAMDANHDGRVSFEEFQAYKARMKLEREREMFRRMAGGRDSLTLDQLERMHGPHDGRPGPADGAR